MSLAHVTCPGITASTLYTSGETFGTYYYDIKTQCPSEPNGYPETNGYPFCADAVTPLKLIQLGTNNVVAIARSLFNTGKNYCGKKVIVYYNGVQIAPPDPGSFFVGDACEACSSDGHIDFSVSGLQQINTQACTLGKVPGISFQIVDELVFNFSTSSNSPVTSTSSTQTSTSSTQTSWSSVTMSSNSPVTMSPSSHVTMSSNSPVTSTSSRQRCNI
ncbi:hypothetical protein EBZ38_05680 [bacterium]|nr:hypothetical protein [bacterium]